MRFVALFLALIVFNISCKHKRIDRTVETSKVKVVSTINKKLWGYKTDFNVCWESPTNPKYPDVNEVKTDIMEHVVKEFSKTPIKFGGWESCGTVDASGIKPDIRMFIFDNPAIEENQNLQNIKAKVIANKTGSITKKYPGHPMANIGITSKNVVGGFQVSLYGTKAHPKYLELFEPLTEKGKRNLIVSVALHEFGHALGLEHEDWHLVRDLESVDGVLARFEAHEHFAELHNHAVKCKELGYEEKAAHRRLVGKRKKDPESYGFYHGQYNPNGFMNRCYYWVSHNYNEKPLEINDLDAKGIAEFIEYQKNLAN